MTPARLATDCPQCHAPLRLAKNRRDGGLFLGCTRYPRCRFTEEYAPVVQDLRRRLEALEAQARGGTTSFPAAPTDWATLKRELMALIALAHPDHWDNHPVATALTQALLQARTRLLQEGR
jgi:ssDNA-binding Zn-finger/Zn-ribbon topoisomerase 1